MDYEIWDFEQLHKQNVDMTDPLADGDLYETFEAFYNGIVPGYIMKSPISSGHMQPYHHRWEQLCDDDEKINIKLKIGEVAYGCFPLTNVANGHMAATNLHLTLRPQTQQIITKFLKTRTKTFNPKKLPKGWFPKVLRRLILDYLVGNEVITYVGYGKVCVSSHIEDQHTYQNGHVFLAYKPQSSWKSYLSDRCIDIDVFTYCVTFYPEHMFKMNKVGLGYEHKRFLLPCTMRLFCHNTTVVITECYREAFPIPYEKDFY